MHTPTKRLALVLMSLVAVASVARVGAQTARQTIAMEHARLIDGLGGPPVDDVTLIIEDGRISTLGPGLPAPPGARIIDLSGRSIMPGLVSDHSHVGRVDGVAVSASNYTRDHILRQLSQFEAYGVTTVTALGLNRSPLFDDLRAEMHAGNTPGADLYGVDQGIGAPAGAPPADDLSVAPDQLFRPSTPRAARQAVDAMASRGTDLIKLWLDDLRNNEDKPACPKMKPDVYKAVIAEAHRKGLRVAAHIYDLDDAKALVAAGVDMIAHGVRDREVDADFIAAMKRGGVWYIPTIGLDESGYLFAEHPGMLDDPFFAAALQPALRAQIADPAWRAKTLASPATAGARRAVAMNERNLKILLDAGVKVGFGTDSGAAPLRIPGWAEHRELKLMVEAGLTPMRALTTATRDAARLMGLGDRGVLAVGRRADILVLSADPSEAIANADRIEAVWRGGRLAAGAISGFDGAAGGR